MNSFRILSSIWSRSLVVVVCTLVATPNAAFCDLVGLKFVGGNQFIPSTDQPVTGTAGAPGLVQANWNNLSSYVGSAGDLVDSSGQTTGVGVSWSGSATWAADAGAAATQDGILMNDYLDSVKDTTVTFSGISWSDYNLVIYFNEDSPQQDRIFHYQIGSQSVFVQDDSLFNGTYVEAAGSSSDLGVQTSAGNYVVLTGLSGPSFTLDSIPGSSLLTARSVINAIQIESVATPEPLSAGLMCLGLCFLIVRTLRSRLLGK